MAGGTPAPPAARNAAALRAIRLAHTFVWAFFAGSILAIPVFAWARQFAVAAALIAVVAVEVVVLMFNRLRCPMTAVAARYTEDRRANFDIYLPLWVARYNKEIFGSLFVAGALYTLLQWRSA